MKDRAHVTTANQKETAVIDARLEKLITLEDAAKFAPGYRPGRCVSTAAVRRWVRYGMRGVLLETVMAGGRRCTSLEAIQRFFEALTTVRAPLAARFDRRPQETSAATIRALQERHGITVSQDQGTPVGT